MRIKAIAAALTLMLVTMSPGSWATGRMGEIHEYCGETIAIIVGTPISFSADEVSAEFKVEQWIRPLAGTQPDRQPSKLHLIGGPGNFKGQTFHKLATKGRFLVFVFPGGRTGDGRLGSIIEIGEQDALPRSSFLSGLDPQPKTLGELVAQIRLVLSKEYRKELTEKTSNTELRDPERAEAARRLGALFAKEAWATLETQATKPGRDEESAVARESLLALFRIDEAKATPVCLKIVRDSKYDYQVGTAAWLLAQRPSDDPKSLDILLAATRRWETEARYPADHPLPELIQAVSALGKKTPEVEALVMRSVEKGSGNVLVTSMAAASHLKIRRAVPFVCQHLKSEDKTVNVSGSASLAIAYLVGEDFKPYVVNRQVTEDEARQSAADAFPDWRKAITKAQTIPCCRGDRIVIASDNGAQMYVLVGWQQQAGKPEPYRKAVLLFKDDEPRK